MEFKCPQCGQMVEAEESARGQVAACPHCGKGIIVPRNGVQSKSTITTSVACPVCGTKYEVDKKDIGQSIVCETCGKSFAIRPRTTKLDMNMIPQNKAEPQACSSCGSGGQGFPLWICVGVLVLNLAALTVLCFNLREIGVTLEGKVGALEGKVGALGSKMGVITEELEHMEKSRHNDAAQIYDRMGRMKLY